MEIKPNTVTVVTVQCTFKWMLFARDAMFLSQRLLVIFTGTINLFGRNKKSHKNKKDKQKTDDNDDNSHNTNNATKQSILEEK